MNLRGIGCNFRLTPVELRERLAFDPLKLRTALAELNARYASEAVILSTCNRVEIYLARPDADSPVHAGLIAEFLAEFHNVPIDQVEKHLYEHVDAGAVSHLFRVASSLDSLIVGEGQIAGQVKEAFDLAQKLSVTGPFLNALFPAALRVAKRVRTETGISKGHVSVSSVAVDYVRQVFDTFADKTVLVIGAGKMGRLTLKHLQALAPGRILVTNRSPEKAAEVAAACHGQAIPWDALDEALIEADIVLSTTGAPQPIVTRRWFDERVLARRSNSTMVVLDIAVPRDWDARIHDGDRVCLFNIDDLTRIREQTLAARKRHIPQAEVIVEQEVRRFVEDWNRRKSGPVIGQLSAEIDRIRQEVTAPLLARLNGKLSDQEKALIEKAFRQLQNKILHGPIAALEAAHREGHGSTLLEAVKKLFRLKE